MRSSTLQCAGKPSCSIHSWMNCRLCGERCALEDRGHCSDTFEKEERFDAEVRTLVLFITELDLRRGPFMAENAMLAVPLFSMC